MFAIIKIQINTFRMISNKNILEKLIMYIIGKTKAFILFNKFYMFYFVVFVFFVLRILVLSQMLFYVQPIGSVQTVHWAAPTVKTHRKRLFSHFM